MAALTGDLGPMSTDANQVQLGANTWRYRRTLASTDTLTLRWLGKGTPRSPLSIVGSENGIIETVHVQKVVASDAVSVRMVNYPASLGAVGAQVGASPAGNIGDRVAAGQIWQSSIPGSLLGAEELIIDNSLGTDSVDVTVIAREDL